MAISGHRLAAVDAYIAKSQPFAQPILAYLREIYHEAAPALTEAIKWGMPFFVLQASEGPAKPVILGNMAAFKQHCSLGLWGPQITAALRADGLGEAGGMGTFGRFASLAELPSRSTLVGYVRLAAQAVSSGERTTSLTRSKAKAAKPAVVVPDALATALSKSKAAARNFAAMSPSCRREYTEWIAGAKRDETRVKRVATAIEWIAQGKSRNWKYESC